MVDINNTFSDLTARDVKRLSGARQGVFATKVLLWAGALALATVLLLTGGTWVLLGALLAGLFFAHGNELQHQALHGVGFPSRGLNRAVGFLLGLPMLVSYSHYRDRHLHHHRYVGTEKDNEFFDASARLTLSHMLMLRHYASSLSDMARAWRAPEAIEIMAERNRSDVVAEYRVMSVLLPTYLSLAIVNGLWPLLIAHAVASIAKVLIEYPEHKDCGEDPDIYRNTRSIRSNGFMTWYTNGNNFHVEHHLYPHVTPEKLHLIHDRIAERIVYTNDGYIDFIRQQFARRRR